MMFHHTQAELITSSIVMISSLIVAIYLYVLSRKMKKREHDLKIVEEDKKRVELLSNRFQNMFKNHNAIMLLVDPESGKIEDFNRSAEKFYGYSKDEFSKLNIESINTLSSKEIRERRYEAKDNKQNCFVFNHKLKSGEIKVVEVNSSPIETEKGIFLFSIVKDITQERENEKRLKTSLSYLKHAQKIAKIGVWEHKYYDNSIYWSDEIYEMFEIQKYLPPSFELFISLVHPDDRDRVEKIYTEAVENKVDFDMNYRLLINKKIVKFIESKSIFELDKDGKTYRSFGVIYDVTEQKELSISVEVEKERYKKLLEFSSDGIHILDREGNIVEVSQKFANMLGYDHHEVLHLNVRDWDVSIPEDRLVEIIAGLLKNPRSFETKHKRKDGSIIDVQINAKGIQLESEMYLYASSRDITKEKELSQIVELEKERYKKLMDLASDGVYIMSLDGKLIEFSRVASKMLGYSREEMKKLSVYDWDTNISKESFNQIIQSLSSEPIIFETKHKRKDGTTYDASITAVKIDIGTDEYIYASVRDISSEKELSKKLIEAKEISDKANQSKSQFLANMSHEIRTPLNGVIGLTDIVLDTDLNPIQREYLQKAKQSSIALLNIINDILDYSKIEAGKLELLIEEFDINDLLKSISDLFGYRIYEKDLDFSFTVDQNIPDILIGDSLRIAQVLNNLIGNSIKFTERGYISLDIALQERDEHQLELLFSVKDSGIGISEKYHKRLFNSFEQGDSSTTKKFGGTGLGLVISKQLVELMKGKIWFESRNRVGTTFHFSIALGYKSRIETRGFDIEKLKGSKFLIVEDSEIERRYLTKILNSWGINSLSAEDGDDALSLLSKNSFDYMLLDWKMPKVDGLSLLKRLKAENRKLPHTLMITAYAKKELMKEARSKSIDIHQILEKPYTPSTLYSSIFEKHLSHSLKSNDEVERKIRLSSIKNALLVEDNKINQLVAQKLLQKIGFEVDIAENGIEGLKMCRSNSYDIVFMDLQMPVMDGFEASRKIREFNREIPIVALSAAVMKRDRELTKEAGMSDHIAKPINMKELENVIKKYLDLEVRENDFSEDEQFHISISGVDMKELLNSLNGDKNELYSLYNSFKESYGEIDFSKFDINSIEIKEYLHKLKGVSGNLKIETIYNRVQELEIDISEDGLKDLEIEVKRVCREIEKYISPLLKEESQNEMNSEELQKEVSSIIDDLDNFVYIPQSDIENLIKKLDSYLNDSDRIVIEKIDIRDYEKLIKFFKRFEKRL